MAKESDATIVVVEAGKYQLENIRWAIDELKENNAIIAGIILNKLVGKSKCWNRAVAFLSRIAKNSVVGMVEKLFEIVTGVVSISILARYLNIESLGYIL